jgi:phosphatidylserine/phosphatidylglycerophosphate/cardiolipin synthase-like enzyme
LRITFGRLTGLEPHVQLFFTILDLEGPSGVLHAKALVADDEAVFVTSANLTEAALDRNIELGVLIHDRAFALTIGGYFRNLIDRNLLKPLPLA